MKRILTIILITTLTATNAWADRYAFDKSHTYINFYVNHLGFSEMMGRFTQYDGAIDYDETNPAATRINVSLSPSSIKTSSDILDLKLQTSDFFDSATYPDIRFISSNVDITGENTADITGNLTLRGITKPVILRAHINKADYNRYTSLYVIGFSATTVIHRSDFGMTTLLPDVGDTVKLDISSEIINLTRKQAESLKKQ